MTAIPGVDNEVRREIDRRAARVPRRRRRRYTAAAYETAGVESNFQDLPGGDADSYGFRQQRESIYGRQNLGKQVDNLFNEFAQHDRGQASFQLAADAQRPAAQYRGRYRDWQGAALKALDPASSQGRMPSSGSRTITETTSSEQPTFDQGGYDQAVRRQKVAQLLSSSGRSNSILFKSGLLSTKPVDPTAFQGTQTVTSTNSTRVPVPGSGTSGAPAGDALGAALREASSLLGVKEDNGSNRSKDVDKLQQGFGMIAQPWCGIYVGTVLRKAGVKVDSRVASVSEIETMARNKTGGFEGGWHSAAHAAAGDAVVTRQGEHVAYVESVDPDGTLHTIGGNQGAGEVSRHDYKPGEVYGVARPRYGTRQRGERSRSASRRSRRS